MDSGRITVRADMAAAIAQEMHRRGVPDHPARGPWHPTEGLMQAAMGAGMAMIWAALLGAWFLGVI